MEKLQCMFLKIGGETPLETLVNDRFLPILMANFEKKWEWPVIYRPNGRDEAFIIPKTSHTVDSSIIFGKIVWLWPVQNQKPAAASKYEWEDSGAKLPPFCLHILHAPIPSKNCWFEYYFPLDYKNFSFIRLSWKNRSKIYQMTPNFC